MDLLGGTPTALRALMVLARATVDTGLDLLLPRPCPGCGGAQPWCPGCAAALGSRPRPVQLPEATLDALAGVALPPVRALARYSGPVRAAIIAGKERGRRDLLGHLGRALGRGLLRLLAMSVLSGEIWLVPAPSRRSAARARGGDPVTAMARAAAALLAGAGVPAGVAPCLYTSGRARDSVGLDAAARAVNLTGRIRFVSGAGPPAGVPVVLLDDVLTTGSTLVASLRMLALRRIPVAASLFVATAAPWQSAR